MALLEATPAVAFDKPVEVAAGKYVRARLPQARRALPAQLRGERRLLRTAKQFLLSRTLQAGITLTLVLSRRVVVAMARG